MGGLQFSDSYVAAAAWCSKYRHSAIETVPAYRRVEEGASSRQIADLLLRVVKYFQ
jgi:hypothetical protein